MSSCVSSITWGVIVLPCPGYIYLLLGATLVLPFDWTTEQLFDGPGCLRVMHEIVVGEIGPDDMYLIIGDVE